MRVSALPLCIAWLVSMTAAVAQTPVGTVISNQATVSFNDHGGRAFVSHSDIARLSVAAGARLAVTINAVPDPVAPGDTLIVEVAVDNPGNAPAQEVVVTAAADVPGSILAAEDAAATVDGLQISWSPIEVAAGSRLLRQFRIGVDSTAQHGSDFGIEATATAANINEPVHINRRVGIDFAPNLILTKSPDRSSVSAGGAIEYVVTCTNTGNAPAGAVRVRDDVEAALTPITSSRPFTTARSVLTWDLGAITAGETVSFQVQMGVSDEAAEGSQLSNRVSATARGTAPDGTGRSFVFESPVAIVVVTGEVFSVAKAVLSGQVVPGRGDTLTYGLELTNTAAIAAGPVVLRDTLPEPLRLVSVQAEVPVTVRGQIVEATWSDVAAGSTVLMRILTRVDSVALPELITNRAWAETARSAIPSNAVETVLRQDQPTDGVVEQPARIFAGAEVTVEVRDADANQRPTEIDTVDIRVVNERTGEVETLLLAETGIDTGVFAGALTTAHNAQPGDEFDGRLLVLPGDRLVSTYVDAETASGEAAQRVAQTEVITTSIALRVNPDVVVANGTERAIFTATLTDDAGAPLPDGTTVIWRAEAGVFENTDGSADSNGQSMIAGGGGEARVALTAPQSTRRDTISVVASLAGFDSQSLGLQLLPGVIGVRVYDGERGIEVTAADPDLEVTVRVTGTTSAGGPLSQNIDLDDSGVFVVDQLPPGDYALDVTVEEVATGRQVFAGLLQQIRVAANGTATPPANSISGILRGRSEASGRRYAGSVVELLDRATGAVEREGVVDSEGGYAFHDLSAGTYDLRVVFDDGTTVTRPVPEPSEVAGTTLVNTDILIDPFGIVFDAATGEAVAAIEVSLRMNGDTILALPRLPGTGAVPNGDNVNPFTTAADGRYAFLFGGDQVGSFGQPQTYTMAVAPPEGSTRLPRRLLLSVQPSRAGPVESMPITMRVSAADGLPLARPNSFALTTEEVVLADIETIALHVPLFGRAPVMEFAKVAFRDTAAPGESVDFGLAVANTGNDTARAVTLTDSLGLGWEIEWTDRGTLMATDVVRWELGAFAPGRRDTLGLRARVVTPQAHGTVLTNAAHLSVAGGFPLRAEADVVVNSAPRWALSKEALSDSVTAGQEVEYLLTYRNEGTDIARGGTLIDSLVGGLSVVAAQGAQVDGNVVSWSLDDVAVGGSGSRRLVARVGADLVPGMSVVNKAVLIAADGSVAAVDSVAILTRVPRLNLVKWALADTVTQGDQVTFMLAVVNEGEAPVTSVTLVDSLPSPLRLIDEVGAVTPDAVTIEPRAVTWQLDSLAAGASDTFRVRVVVEALEPVTNRARLLIAAQTIATATATVAVRERPPLELSLMADAPTLEAGATITYTATLGATAAVAGEVVVVDSLPAALVYAGSGDGPQPDYDVASNVLTWTVADLRAEQPLSLTFAATVAQGLPPGESVAHNRVVGHLAGQQFVSERIETLITVPFLRVEKSADVTVVEVGDFVEYRIRLHNTSAGADTLRNILINDWSPSGFRYADGTAMLDGVPQQPDQPGAGLLLWSVPPLAASGVTELVYRLVVGLEAPFGDGDNTVRVSAQSARGADLEAGPVTARVRVRPDLFSRGELILGRAWIDADGDGLFGFDEEVVPGVALLMEDGTRIIADRHGKFSVPEVRPGDHVLRVLEHHLPEGLEPVPLGNRAAGDAWSRFVTVPVAGSAKANFPFRRTIPQAGPEGEEEK